MFEPTEYARRLIWASHFPNVGRKRLLELARDRLFVSLPESQISDVFPEVLSARIDKVGLPSQSSHTDKMIGAARERGDRIIAFNDAAYPEVLRSSPQPPALLFVRGRLESLRKPPVAIIGTRSPTLAGEETARRITAWFVEHHWTVVSGLALGIDTIAHSVCVSANSETVAVLAHGLDTLHPKSNTKLAHSILDKGGCLISEYGYGVAPFPGNFVERDAVQAFLSLGVVLVQSGLQGGSLHASRAILKANRKLLVAAPSRNDRMNHEPKAEANVQLVDGGVGVAVTVLKIDAAEAENIVALHSKDELPRCEEMLLKTLHKIRDSQKRKITSVN